MVGGAHPARFSGANTHWQQVASATRREHRLGVALVISQPRRVRCADRVSVIHIEQMVRKADPTKLRLCGGFFGEFGNDGAVFRVHVVQREFLVAFVQHNHQTRRGRHDHAVGAFVGNSLGVIS